MFGRAKTIAQKFDWPLLIAYLILVVTGLSMVFTTTYYDAEGQNMWSFNSEFGRQLIWAGISLFLLILAYSIEWQFWNSLAIPIYIAGVVLLILTLFIGKTINGAKSWIFIGPFSLQTGEIAKLTTAIYLASILASIKIKLREPRNQLMVVGIILIPAILIIFQPDPGSAITFFSLFILAYRRNMPSIYYLVATSLFLTVVISLKFGPIAAIAGISIISLILILDFQRERLLSIMITLAAVLINIILLQYGFNVLVLLSNLLLVIYALFFRYGQNSINSRVRLLGSIAALAFIAYVSNYAFENVLKSHQQERINVWLKPEKSDPRGSLYNLIQSRMAISSGGLQGKGFMNGTYTKLNYVPAQTTDFIFTSICEEQGFIGSASVVILFLIIVVRLLQIGEFAKNRFVQNFCYAVAGFFFIHFFINIGMTLGIAPVIGIPLPLFSKGGSAFMAFSIMIGIALRMSRSQ